MESDLQKFFRKQRSLQTRPQWRVKKSVAQWFWYILAIIAAFAAIIDPNAISFLAGVAVSAAFIIIGKLTLIAKLLGNLDK